MKKGTSILLLAVFFLFQAGRILLYFECRFSNSITTSSCDCVQILTDIKPGSPNDVIPSANHTNHRHLPEEFEMGYTVGIIAASLESTDLHAADTGLFSSSYYSDIFHPPIA